MAKELKLEAKSHNEELVLNYLKETATDVLAEKINNGTKTMQGCWNYILGEAKKKAVAGCACIEDSEVFGWATHYFYEDSIEECKTAPATVKTTSTKSTANEPKKETPVKKQAPPKQQEQNTNTQLSFFDL